MKVEEITLPGSDGATTTVFEKRLVSRERSVAEAVARLRAEADLLARLGGRITPTLAGSGEDERGPWLRTEAIGFPTLAQRLERGAEGEDTAPRERAFDTTWVERAIRAAFAALAGLHEAADAQGPLHVVHADLSPANLAVDEDARRAVILDLELASWRGGVTRDGAFRGTVGYCAPEIARGDAATVASDLFALAATFFHVVLGAPPRDGPSLAAVLGRAAEQPLLEELHVRVACADLASRGPAHAMLVRCLAHAPAERPGSAREVLSLLGGGRLC